ncbi:NYN domain-containing protein [Tautonia plasticadhaerens]|uniref:YacP-like NYN domain protein n=1 Tax=Tautonia plasticadhaerens TaxID=2527974 RepID=A0A518GZD3_9BACT|nr:NYN domain-containing protein [Tautonia plasticadhaerens]QDV33957.1 YacP-like NYN domain protein [Tautonia plasticadhaerens]
MNDPSPGPARLIVDAMNVIGSRPTGWWRDRDAAKLGLVGRLRGLAPEVPESIVVVIDGRPLPDLPEGEQGGVTVLYASRRGPDAADDRIVEIVARGPGDAVVATSDRDLSRRVRDLGAEVRGASWLLSRLDRLDRAGEGGE